MNESIEERIARVKKGKTTKSQKKLIEYLERVDYENIIYLSITELADSTKVAEATILRFCRLLGFNGYQEFKLNMAQEMSGGRLKAGDSEYIRDISENYARSLEKCRQSLSSAAVEKAIRLHFVLPYGVLFRRGKFLCSGPGAAQPADEDGDLFSVRAGRAFAEYPHFLLRQRGRARDVQHFGRHQGPDGRRRARAYLRHENHRRHQPRQIPPHAVCRCGALLRSDRIPHRSGAMASKIVQLFLVDILCTGIYFKDKKKYGDCIAKSNAAVVGKLI